MAAHFRRNLINVEKKKKEQFVGNYQNTKKATINIILFAFVQGDKGCFVFFCSILLPVFSLLVFSFHLMQPEVDDGVIVTKNI